MGVCIFGEGEREKVALFGFSREGEWFPNLVCCIYRKIGRDS